MKYFLLLFFLPMPFAKGLSQDAQQQQRPVYYFNPRWSPDGSRVLFESTLGGESNIYTISKEGADLKQITQQAAGQAAWSPDGTMIVYYRSIDQNLQLFVNSASGSAEKQLLISDRQDYGPSWSSKDVIAYMSNPARGHIAHHIYTLNANGTNLKRITDDSYDCMSPRWSPDGKKILFIRGLWTSKTYKEISREEMQKINASAEIMVMNADGMGAYRIADNKSPFKDPVWSSDGRSIYLKSDLDAATEIYRVNRRGKNLTKVCRINKRIGSFDVSPRGDLIVFEYEENKKFSIHTFDIQKSLEQKLIGDI